MSDSQTTFEVFYREHKDSVFRAMVVWTGDATFAEDLVAKGNDAWIAATAHATASTLITYDETLAVRYATVGTSRLLTL